MKSKKIPKKILNTVIGEVYEGPYTLSTDLDSLKEPVVDYYVNYNDRKGPHKYMTFIVWTEHFVGQLVDNIFGDRNVIWAPRNPCEKSGKVNGYND